MCLPTYSETNISSFSSPNSPTCSFSSQISAHHIPNHPRQNYSPTQAAILRQQRWKNGISYHGLRICQPNIPNRNMPSRSLASLEIFIQQLANGSETSSFSGFRASDESSSSLGNLFIVPESIGWVADRFHSAASGLRTQVLVMILSG